MTTCRWRSLSGLLLSSTLALAGCELESDGTGGLQTTDESSSRELSADGGRVVRADRVGGGPVTAIEGPVGAHDAGIGSSKPSGSALDAALASPPDAQNPLPSAPEAHVPPALAADCALSGTFALRIDAQVRWQGTALFDLVPVIVPGRGTMSIHALVEVSQQGDHYATRLRGCGAQLPDFAASVGEQYGAVFPDEIWDKLDERWTTRARTSCAQPGCTFETDFVTAQLGTRISPHASWPAPRDPVDPATLRDDDEDGTPGVTLRVREQSDGGTYQHPPTSYLANRRIDELSIALRVGADLQGNMPSCDTLAGTIANMAVELRALGCRLDTGEPCKPEEVDFVDDNLPVWKAEGGRWTSLRMPVGASCADARRAQP